MAILAAAAMTGFALSAAWHMALRLGVAPPSWLVAVPLLGGLFAVWFPVVIVTAQRGLVFSRRRWWWAVAATFCTYAFVNMWLLSEVAVERRGPIALSGHLMAFYSFAVAMVPPVQGEKS